MLWLTAVALIAAFFIWVLSPDPIGALWVTVGTVGTVWLVIESLAKQHTRDERTRDNPRAIPKSGDYRHRPHGTANRMKYGRKRVS
jgi:hypothetical protein